MQADTTVDISVPAARAAARLSRQVERALAPVELSLPQYRLLALLGDSEELASALAGLLAVRPPSVTALVDGLVQRGLVERRASEGDRRCVAHVLTDAGRAVLARGDEAVGARLVALSLHLPEGDAGAALAGLERWGQALDAARDTAHDTAQDTAPGPRPFFRR